MSKSFLSALILCLGFVIGQTQTVGVMIYDQDQTTEGYTFFSPMLNNSSYLVDDCGFLINQWDRSFIPGLGGHFLEDGSILRTAKVDDPFFSQASRGGLVEHIDWDNNLLWAVTINDEQKIQHHDAVMMPNGNMLVVGWERLDAATQISLGRPADQVSEPNLWGEFLYEVQRTGTYTFDVVWEWHLKDHFVQDTDPSLANYGVISDSPGKVDINYNGPGWWGERDWWHCNAIDYHPGRDQIVINSRNNNELWIIDHSTTTAEAATDTGGNSGKGGSLLYRWGNPQAYDRGSSTELRMYGSHGIHFIDEGLPNAGKIMYFNNGDRRPGFDDYSTIEMITLPVDGTGNYQIEASGKYGPTNPEVVYKASDPEDFYSTYLSNAQQMPNGNVFINEGQNGRFFEVNAAQEIVWEYINPINYFGPMQQGEDVVYNRTFRAYKYPTDYMAFLDKNIVAGEVIQTSDPNHFCSTISTVEKEKLAVNEFYFDLGSRQLFLELDLKNTNLNLSVYSTSGELIKSEKITFNSNKWDLSGFSSGVYVVSLSDQNAKMSKKIIIP